MRKSRRDEAQREVRVVREWLSNTPVDRGGTKPVGHHTKPIGLTRSAYRHYRRDFVDSLSDGYIDRLSPADRDWMERFLREEYDADNRLLKSSRAIHRDYVRVAKGTVIPKRWRHWWGRQGELFLDVAANALNMACDAEVASVRYMRKECYGLQNAAYRDAYAYRGVVHVENDEQFSGGESAPPAEWH